MPEENRPGSFIAYLAVTGLGLTMIATRRSVFTYRPEDFFQPQNVAAIADSLPSGTEEGFIHAAWDYVGGSIVYEQIGSDINFTDGKIYCEDCYFPQETLERGVGNCVAKSVLLASILANRLPSNRLRVMVGFFGGEPLPENGHAWVEVERDGDWYILESTVRPPAQMTWILAEANFPMYDPDVVMESTGYLCDSKVYCAAIASCNCGKIEEKLRSAGQFQPHY